MDNRINAQYNQINAAQNSGRGTWGSAHPAFGQTLIRNGKPSDQTNPGPDLGAQLRDFATINVYEGPDGIGWTLLTEAEEAGTYYLREDIQPDGEARVEGGWVEQPPDYVPYANR